LNKYLTAYERICERQWFIVQQRGVGVANKDVEAHVASGEDAEYVILRFQERDRPLVANAPAPRVADWQVRWTRQTIKMVAEHALQGVSDLPREFNQGLLSFLNGDQSDLAMKRNWQPKVCAERISRGWCTRSESMICRTRKW
jgi:hypothetical protein